MKPGNTEPQLGNGPTPKLGLGAPGVAATILPGPKQTEVGVIKDFGYIVDGGADPDVLVRDRLKKGKERLDNVIETLALLCEPVRSAGLSMASAATPRSHPNPLCCSEQVL